MVDRIWPFGLEILPVRPGVHEGGVAWPTERRTAELVKPPRQDMGPLRDLPAEKPRLTECWTLERDISQAIRLIVLTRPGTLPISRDFGCRVHELLFRPLSPATRVALCFFVEAAIRRWERRVTELSVSINEPGDSNSVGIRVAWRAGATFGEEILALTEDTIGLI